MHTGKLLIIPLLLLTCSPKYVIVDNYKNNPMPKGNLFILPIITAGFINEDHFNILTRSICTRWKKLRQIDSVFYDQHLKCRNNREVEFEFNENNNKFILPLDCISKKVAYALQITNLDLNYKTDESSMASMGPNGMMNTATYLSKSYAIQADYIFWDIINDTAICYGHAAKEMSVFLRRITEDQVGVEIISFTDTLLSQTPFQYDPEKNEEH